MEHDVAEAEDGDVLDELLAEVVVDAVGVLLGENLREARGELLDDSRSRPNGFSTITLVSPVEELHSLAAFCATGTKMEGGMER